MKGIIRSLGRRVSGRLHPTIGAALLIIATFGFSISLCTNAHASDLVVASAPDWTTNGYFFAEPDATAPVTISIPQYLTSPREITIQPGGVAIVPLSVPGGFGTIPAPDDVQSFVQLNYDKDTHSSYKLGGIDPSKFGKFIPIKNDDGTITVVTALCKVPTPITVTPRNGAGKAGAREYFLCTPPATQYQLAQTVAAGSLDVAVGNLPFDDGSAWGPVYLIVTVGKPDRDSFAP